MTTIIAEISGNHGGDLGRANELIVAAARAGCDMVKIQTYRPNDMNDPENNDLYQKYRIPEDWYPVLFDTAFRYGIPLFSSVFAPWAIDFLEQFKCPIYKIASPESTQLDPSVYLAIAEMVQKRTRAQLWASSGIAHYDMMEELEPEVIFYCKQGYPADDLNEVELVFIRKNANGFSDHTVGWRNAVAAMGAGATHIEKHFKLDNDCIDWEFSLNPDQMRELCRFK